MVKSMKSSDSEFVSGDVCMLPNSPVPCPKLSSRLSVSIFTSSPNEETGAGYQNSCRKGLDSGFIIDKIPRFQIKTHSKNTGTFVTS